MQKVPEVILPNHPKKHCPVVGCRRASRDEDSAAGQQRRPSLAEKGKSGKCRKHSKCHCFLFSFDSVEFYAVGGEGEGQKEGE